MENSIPPLPPEPPPLPPTLPPPPPPNTSMYEEGVELLEKKMQFTRAHLTRLHSELEEELRTRITPDILDDLTHSIVYDMIIEIIDSLKDIQHANERQLYQTRQNVFKDFKAKLDEIVSKELSLSEQEKAKAEAKRTLDKDLRSADITSVQVLDKLVRFQQQTLQTAGVPCFSETSTPHDLRLQMAIIQLILKLNEIPFKDDKN